MDIIPEGMPLGKLFTPILKLLGIKHRSYYKLAKTALLLGVNEKEGIVTFEPTKKGRYECLPEHNQTAPLTDKPALVQALQRALDKCQ